MSPLAEECDQAAREPDIAGEGPNFKNVREVGQCEPLFEAVSGGQEQMVADLLAAGACPNARFGGEEGYAPLHVASSRGHVGILTTLLAFGAHRDALDSRGARPLHHAIAEDRVAATETLLAAGALSATADDSFEPLVLAACKGGVDIINVLLKHGVDVNSRDDVVGATALHAAAIWSSGAAAVHALIDAGADINVQRKDGGSPLHYAVASRASSSSSSPRLFETILALLERGASVNQVHSGTAQTPLLVACQHCPRGLGSVVDLLLRSGGDETAVGGDGRTASELLELDLHQATENEHQCDVAQYDEIERTHSLLARANEDRAWRRRCLPVMLRARQQRVCTAPNGGIEARRRGGKRLRRSRRCKDRRIGKSWYRRGTRGGERN